MLVAGVDVGNSTTEIAVARTEPGREPEWLFVARRPTTGAKGSEACAEGVAELLAAAERRVGERAHIALLAELHPVETGLVELGRLEELVLEQTAIARRASDTPSGTGVGAGTLVAVYELDGPPRAEPVVPVVTAGIDYEDAAERLRDARAGGWNIIAAIVEADDAVLIGNRFDRSLPIVDEVADAASLPLGARAAVEVAEPGASVEELSDPLRLGVLLGLGPRRLARQGPPLARSPAIAPRSPSACRGAPVATRPDPSPPTCRSSSSAPTAPRRRSTSTPRPLRPAPWPRSAGRQVRGTGSSTSTGTPSPCRQTILASPAA